MQTRKPVAASAQPPSSCALRHGMVGFAAAAPVRRKARDGLEPEHISAPVHHSPGEEAMGQWGGRRDAEVLCSPANCRRGNGAAARAGIREVTG